MNRTKKFVFIALLTASALILSIIESTIPLPFIAPGAKLGLANMVTLSALVVFGFRSAFFVSILRSLLFLLVAGNPIGFIYSIGGSIFSIVIMGIIYKFFAKYFSLVGVSVFGAIAHNTAQITVASIIMENVNIFSYLPVMCIVSLFTGCFVGFTSLLITKNLKKYKFE